MARRRRLGRVVIDTTVVIRAARAFRQQPPEPDTPELRLVLAWRDDPKIFTWLYNQEILAEYREILRRLKVPRYAAGKLLNSLAQGGEKVSETVAGEFSPDPKDDPFYHCALGGDADYIITDNVQDFPPVPNRKRPRILAPSKAVALLHL
jgi:predicted nucleic acid-binding protein